ncbi:hypothetical protein Cabys_3158 [Caldithrix abyssi DSM 13497]|uniref:Uncharacterized protein n=1 Tax=Caldithrix abyssi DSM 13497 TaxID=880073 RepID=A0A1J1CD35_CALAY|nr:hypothetical protein Cabys_3158 [Caldithrix abyssi DSM 13497]
MDLILVVCVKCKADLKIRSTKSEILNKSKSPNFQMFKTPRHNTVLNFCHLNFENCFDIRISDLKFYFPPCPLW